MWHRFLAALVGLRLYMQDRILDFVRQPDLERHIAVMHPNRDLLGIQRVPDFHIGRIQC